MYQVLKLSRKICKIERTMSQILAAMMESPPDVARGVDNVDAQIANTLVRNPPGLVSTKRDQPVAICLCASPCKWPRIDLHIPRPAAARPRPRLSANCHLSSLTEGERHSAAAHPRISAHTVMQFAFTCDCPRQLVFMTMLMPRVVLVLVGGIGNWRSRGGREVLEPTTCHLQGQGSAQTRDVFGPYAC